MKVFSKKKELWPKVKPISRCPQSREEALANPVIYTYDAIESSRQFKSGNLDWVRFNLSRPESLEFDWGIQVKTPSVSGELELNIN